MHQTATRARVAAVDAVPRSGARPVRVYIGIGSNLDPQRQIHAGLERLRERFGALTISPAYRSAAVGFDGPPFINLVAAFDTAEPVAQLLAQLRRIEIAHGRRDTANKFRSCPLDLDLLLYGDHCSDAPGVSLPRRDITEYAHVAWPLADIAGDRRHPALGLTFAQIRRSLRRPVSLERVVLAGDVAECAPLP